MLLKKTNLPKVIKNIYLTKNEPVSIVHFLTNRCNARCSFCFIDFDDPNTFKNELTLEEIEKLTKTLGKSLLNVNLTGGEPFARKDISIDDFPEKHDKVRKIENLFNNCIDTYFRLKKFPSNVNPVVSITVNQENCDDIKNIYNHLVNKCKIDSLKCTIVRDEGIYKTPKEKKENIYKAYVWLVEKISESIKNGIIKNYNKNSMQGRLHNKKDEISWSLTKKMYLEPHFISPCHAGGLFGIISASGLVYPCEILEDKILGDLRKNDMNFMKIWKNQETSKTKKFIKETNCHCTYECALSYNILGNWRYQPKLIKAAFNSY